MLKTVSISFINYEHFIWWGFFQICSGNSNTSLLWYACEVIHLINKGVISPYVQELGGIVLKFNILRLHYVTYVLRCAIWYQSLFGVCIEVRVYANAC